MTRRCLGCRRRIASGSYCPQCWDQRRHISTGWAWGEIRQQIHQRDRVCVQCGSSKRLQVHHRTPLSEGGSNELGNLELRCPSCHTH
jgi:5-methylcytosine-specific restriction endonuclease McrA